MKMSYFGTLIMVLSIVIPSIAIFLFVSIWIEKRKIKKMILSLTINSELSFMNELYYHFHELFRLYSISFWVNTDKILYKKKLKKYQLWVRKIILPWENLWIKVQDYQFEEITLEELQKDL